MKVDITMSNEFKESLKAQSGQSLVEFILLLGGIVIISFTFMKTINSNIAFRWEKLTAAILEDKSQTITIR